MSTSLPPSRSRTDEWGYGVACIYRQKTARAHRVSYELAYGNILIPSLLVCHECDNPPCVRPSHLFLGTNTDNIKDAVSKKRFPHRENHRDSKLTEHAILQIRFMATTMSLHAIARIYNRSYSTIHAVVSHKSWKHIR